MSNLETTSRGDLIFKCGTVVVIMNKSKQQQRFFRKHNAIVTRYTYYLLTQKARRDNDKVYLLFIYSRYLD